MTKKLLPRKPIAVLISDVHYTPNTLSLANICMVQALDKAEELGVPLIDAGDLLDSKAIIRGECANSLINLFKDRQSKPTLLVGNHTLLNEKSKEHTLNFLRPYADIIDEPTFDERVGLYLIPYFSSKEDLTAVLKEIPKSSTIIMHQGVRGAQMGDYILDHSSIEKDAFADFRVISGHYHRAQNIKCGAPRKGAVGLFSYIGNPYSLSFGEANDGPKGFQVLFDDGLMEQVPTELRKHVIVERDIDQVMEPIPNLNTNDLLWLKVKGPFSALEKLSKREIGTKHLGHFNFKFDKITTDSDAPQLKSIETQTKTEILDTLIDASSEAAPQKTSLKALWREVMK